MDTEDTDENPFLVVDLIARFMPVAIDLTEHRTRQESAEVRHEAQTLRARHQESPSFETLTALRKMLSTPRESLQDAIAARDDLARFVRNLESELRQLDRLLHKREQQEQRALEAARRAGRKRIKRAHPKVVRAEQEFGAYLLQERERYENLLTLTRPNLARVDATLPLLQEMLTHAEEQLRHEEQRLRTP